MSQVSLPVTSIRDYRRKRKSTVSDQNENNNSTPSILDGSSDSPSSQPECTEPKSKKKRKERTDIEIGHSPGKNVTPVERRLIFDEPDTPKSKKSKKKKKKKEKEKIDPPCAIESLGEDVTHKKKKKKKKEKVDLPCVIENVAEEITGKKKKKKKKHKNRCKDHDDHSLDIIPGVSCAPDIEKPIDVLIQNGDRNKKSKKKKRKRTHSLETDLNSQENSDPNSPSSSREVEIHENGEGLGEKSKKKKKRKKSKRSLNSDGEFDSQEISDPSSTQPSECTTPEKSNVHVKHKKKHKNNNKDHENHSPIMPFSPESENPTLASQCTPVHTNGTPKKSKKKKRDRTSSIGSELNASQNNDPHSSFVFSSPESMERSHINLERVEEIKKKRKSKISSDDEQEKENEVHVVNKMATNVTVPIETFQPQAESSPTHSNSPSTSRTSNDSRQLVANGDNDDDDDDDDDALSDVIEPVFSGPFNELIANNQSLDMFSSQVSSQDTSGSVRSVSEGSSGFVNTSSILGSTDHADEESLIGRAAVSAAENRSHSTGAPITRNRTKLFRAEDEQLREISEYKSGPWTAKENRQLRTNWESFFELNPHPDPYSVLIPAAINDAAERKENRRFATENGFMMHIGRHLNRTLSNIYHKAKRTCYGGKIGKFSEEEDAELLALHKGLNADWDAIGQELGRYSAVCRRRYEALTTTVRGTLSKEDVKRLKETVTKFKHEHGDRIRVPWKEIAKDFPGRSPSSLGQHWRISIREGYTKDTFSGEARSKLIAAMGEQLEKDSEICWESMHLLFEGQYPAAFLKKQWANIKRRVHNRENKSMKDLVKVASTFKFRGSSE